MRIQNRSCYSHTVAAAMKAVFLLALVVSQHDTFAQQPTTIIGAWMPANPKWQHAPPDVAPKLLTTSTQVLYFQPDGKMVVIGCVVNHEPGRYTVISAGDGLVVQFGDWQADHGKIFAHYHLIFRMVQRMGETLPGPWTEEVLTFKDSGLLLKGVLYQRAPGLDESASEMVPIPTPAKP